MDEKPIVDFEIEGDLEAREALKKARHSAAQGAVVHAIAQSHLDLMWKWDRRDIHEMVLRMFSGHAELLEQNPSYTYSQSQLFLYEYVREHWPELFERIRAIVTEGRWEITGGQWVEPDCNLLDDESTVRQFLVGQRYALKHFGKTATAGWSQDAFGTNPNMPQVLKRAGIEFYVHKRPRHRFMPLPVTPYWLEGADGTRVPALRSNNKGVGLPRVSEGEPFEGTEVEHVAKKNAELGIKDLWGPLGCGDTGGVNDYGEVPMGKHSGLEFRFSTPAQYFEAIQNGLKALPVVREEINFEFPACYTTHADIKQGNRSSERLLNLAEFLCSARYLLDGEYPSERLGELWKLLLYNQFHDGVTGTGLERVHEETLRDYAHIEYTATQIIENAALRIASQADTARFERPYLVFNPNAFELDCPVTLSATISRPTKHFVLTDGRAIEVPGKILSDELLDGNGNYHVLKLLFHVRGIPSCGWLALGLEQRGEADHLQAGGEPGSCELLENAFYRVALNGQGEIEALYDKILGRRINKPGEAFCELKLLGEGQYALDYGRPHKAWNFGLDGSQVNVRFQGAEVVEDNSIRTVLRQRFLAGQSEISRDIELYHTCKRLEFRLSLDWREAEKYLCALFPLDMNPDAGTYHRVPFALVQRDRKQECPSLNYTLKSDESMAFALMTQDRYGFSEPEANTVRLSLLRASTDYGAPSDQGRYEFSFAVSTDAASGFESLARQCEATRQPAFAFRAERHGGSLQGRASLIDTGDCGVLVSAVKRLEEGFGLAVRLFNPFARAAHARVAIHVKCGKVCLSDLLEQEEEALELSDGKLELSFRGHEFKTLLLKDIKA